MVHSTATVTSADRSSDGYNVMLIGERPSLDQYLKLGYVFAQGMAWGGAAETLEESSADFALSQLASRLGQINVARTFLGRSGNWLSVFNADKSYSQDRNDDGTWPQASPISEDGFVEGTSAQYTWMVPYDAADLVEAIGGLTPTNKRLDDFFHSSDGGWALTSGGAHSDLTNEPSLGVPWLYDFTGQPYRTQQTVRQAVNTLWSDTPNGIPGQDDLGAMSSWYVWAALGVYPLTPGRAEMLLGSPLFVSSVIHRSNGKVVKISAHGAGPQASYVESLKVNNETSSKAWLPESFLTKSGKLDFVLRTTPRADWGARPVDAPPSFHDSKRQS